MSEEMQNEDVNIDNNEHELSQESNNDESINDAQQDKGQEQKQGRTFSQEELNDIIERRLARDREDREAMKNKFDQLVSTLQNFGKPQESFGDEQNNQFDPNQTLTIGDLINLQSEAQRQEIEAKRTEHFSRMANETLANEQYKDFKEVTKDHVFTKAVLNNKSLADSLEVLEKPFQFMYDAIKNYPKELEAIANIQEPTKAVAEVVRLEERLKQNAKVPGASNAPGGVSDDHEGSNSESTIGNIQERRKALLNNN